MISRAHAYFNGVMAAVAATLAVPALGLAQSGGAGISGGASSRAQLTVAGGTVQSGDVDIAAGPGAVTISTRPSGFLQSRMQFTGSASGGARGETVEIERLGHETRWSWAPTAHSHLNRGGSFTVTWRANHIGSFQFRAVVSGSPGQLRASSSPVTAIVYRWTAATWYGPTPNGDHTACGQTLTNRTLGTANRTLPCGTLVSLYYHGKTIAVPVIDRGPYRTGVDYDLTVATARRLGTLSAGIATIGAVSLPHR